MTEELRADLPAEPERFEPMRPRPAAWKQAAAERTRCIRRRKKRSKRRRHKPIFQ